MDKCEYSYSACVEPGHSVFLVFLLLGSWWSKGTVQDPSLCNTGIYPHIVKKTSGCQDCCDSCVMMFVTLMHFSKLLDMAYLHLGLMCFDTIQCKDVVLHLQNTFTPSTQVCVWNYCTCFLMAQSHRLMSQTGPDSKQN